MNKRTYRKIVKRILSYGIHSGNLTPLEKRVDHRFQEHCCKVADYYLTILDAEDDYYKYLCSQ